MTPPAPVGRPAALGCEVLDTATWWTQLLSDVSDASEVSVSTLLYDHQGLTGILLRKLRLGNFKVEVVVDREACEAQPPVAPRQAPRLRALCEAGAEVLLARGVGRLGRLHGKALVCDRRVAYCGCANFTDKSSANSELCLRLRGPPVADVLKFVIDAKKNARLLG